MKTTLLLSVLAIAMALLASEFVLRTANWARVADALRSALQAGMGR